MTMRDRILRIGLAFLAIGAAVVGGWAAFAPKSFYTDFPGGGRHWISADGPFNEHLVRDVGELNLALVVITVWAIVSLSMPLVRATLAGWIVTGALHTIYHFGHMHPDETSDQLAIGISLTLVPVVAIGLLLMTRGADASSGSRSTARSGQPRSAAPDVGALAVIGLVAAGPQLALPGLLAHDCSSEPKRGRRRWSRPPSRLRSSPGCRRNQIPQSSLYGVYHPTSRAAHIVPTRAIPQSSLRNSERVRPACSMMARNVPCGRSRRLGTITSHVLPLASVLHNAVWLPLPRLGA